MATFTDTWNAAFKAIPADTRNVSLGAGDIRTLKVAISERLAICISLAGDAHDGKILQAVFKAITTPTLEADDIALYGKVVSTKTELHFLNEDGTETQITSGAHLLLKQFMQNVNGQDYTLSRVNLLDYGEVTNAIGSTGGGTQDIDLTLGNVVTATVDTSANTFTFSNPTASDEGCGFVLFLTNGGSQTVNWPASVDWPGGTAPTLTASGVDILVFNTVDGGTTWYGNLVGAAYAQ